MQKKKKKILQDQVKTITKFKTGGFRRLFLPRKDFKTCSALNFPKDTQILEARDATKDMKFRLDFFSHALLHMNSL